MQTSPQQSTVRLARSPALETLIIEYLIGTAFACFVASGQTCVSGTRVIVEDSIYERFVPAFVEKVKSIEERMGDREYSHVRAGLDIQICV